MSTSTSLCYLPGFGHNWTVPHGQEHLFWPHMHQQISSKDSVSLHYVRWGINESEPRNPIQSFQKYFREELRAESNQAFEIVQSAIDRHRPELLITHSMGARALYHGLQKGLQIPTVKKVILLQPDIPVSYDMSQISREMLSNNINFSHTWCPWDDLLGLISIYTGELRIGQLPHTEKTLKSHFVALPFTAKKWCHTQVLHQDINHLVDHPELLCG